jgi:glycosyltransferase involved in cell wall biosynthesis
MISVVIPCYNESAVLRLTYATVVEAARSWGEPIELVLVDDGSSDGTWAIIEALAESDGRVVGVRLARNFGHQAALGAGLERARGEAVVVLDADLQDPPALVAELISRWREGYDIVYARRNRRRGESVFKRVVGNLFYRLLDRISDVPIPRDTGDFALMDARAVRHLLGFREHALFWRGLRCWAGFRQAAVHFDRPGRARGESKYTLRKLFALAGNGLLSFSHLPLRLPFYLGFITLALTLGAGLPALAYGLFRPDSVWLTVGVVALVVGLFGSIQLLCLGIMGEYLNRIYDEVRDRPRWIVEATAGQAQSERLPILRATERSAG